MGFFFFFLVMEAKDRMVCESFRVLIPYRKPKSNNNGNYKRVIEREEENGG